MTFLQNVRQLRAAIKDLAARVKGPHDVDYAEDRDAYEVLANIELSYRHLEDAAMRLGKAIQAYDGGVSIYDK